MIQLPRCSEYDVFAGSAHPVGPTMMQGGVNFSVFSENATGVELLLFDSETAPKAFQTITLVREIHRTFGFWHVFVKDLPAGTLYGYRIDGPLDLDNGHRFDRLKLALDPYSRGVSSALWDRAAACQPGDNVAKAMRSVVVDWSQYDWEGDVPLNRPMQDLVIYELNVGGFTRSPSSGVSCPGTFAGVVEKIPYLQSLGVTAVELLPVHAFDAGVTLGKGPAGQELRNFWGYSTVGFFALERTYCEMHGQGSGIDNFRDMVKALHRAGIEVILDVVFNHTDEGNHQGPSMCFRLLDNSVYYHLVPKDKKYYMDYSGCGNTVNCNHPIVAKFILECLEFWAREMHVDGFRFDEGSILTRDEDGNTVNHPPIIWAIELSEVLSGTKVIAEAWDAGGAYQVGRFPGNRWAEWNGRFRDEIRNFVRGRPGLIGSIAAKIGGSADIYQSTGHLPVNSVNFVNCHDGFTLNDLVSYNTKNNFANGEDNNDGANDNNSWNCGVEGPTHDAKIERFREQQIKNYVMLLMLSQGVPMFVAGDEFRRTQEGNNNAYCQDNEISWVDWTLAEKNSDILRFFRLAIRFRKNHLILRRGTFFTGEINSRGLADISWHDPWLNDAAWNDPEARQLAVTLGGREGNSDLHVMISMGDDVVPFTLPVLSGHAWQRVVDTSLNSPNDILGPEVGVIVTGKEYLVNGHSIVVLVSSPMR